MYHEFINHYAGCLLAATQAASRRCRYPRLGREEARESQAPPVGERMGDFSNKAGQWIFIYIYMVYTYIYLDPTGQSDNHSQLDFSRAMLLFSISCFSDSSLHCWCPLIMGSDDWRTWFALASEMRISPATEARVERPHSRRSSRILSSAWQLFTLRMYGFPIHWNDHFPL